ncbi:MAG: type II secretion system GspH family protein [Polyangiaceae bacterium]|nr:type II secretion system GspH family protein [Polyangiaceae bacterium]
MQRNATVSVHLVRTASRGVTLIEVLIVVAIMSLIAAGVTVAVLPRYRQAQIETATTNARAIRDAVNRWRAMRGGDECPTVSQLVQDKEIDSASKATDPWDQPYKIQCSDDETMVSSPGPDKKENSKDDIVVPERSDQS